MSATQIISIAAGLAIFVASVGQLPKVVVAVRKAQVLLIQESKASRWSSIICKDNHFLMRDFKARSN